MSDNKKNDEPIIKNEDDKLKLVVEKSDAVLILGKDMTIKMAIEQFEEGEPITNNALLISAIATRLNLDHKFPEQLIEFLESFGQIDEYGITSLMGKYSVDTDGTMSDEIVWN